MKIAFLVNNFPSLSETFIQNQIIGVIERGHDVTIFAGRPRSALKIPVELKKYNLLERTIYPQIPKNKIFRLWKGLIHVVRFILINPLPILKSLNIFRYKTKATSLTLLYQIIPFLENNSYDIIHCQFGVLGLKGLCIKQILGGTTKLVTSFRGYDASVRFQDEPGFYDELFREGDLFIPVSQSLKNRIVLKGCSRKKIIVLHSGINCEKLTFSERNQSSGEPTKVITLARLVEKKGICNGIKAIAQVVKTGRYVNYVVVGDGKLKCKLELLIKELNVESHVQLLGWRNYEEAISLLQNSHIMLAPSITAANGDQEGIPNAIKEAMAMGLPVISTIHGGIPELVEDGISGFLVKEGDIDALTYRLSYLIDHPETWATMGRAGHNFVKQNYDINKLNDRLVDLYRTLLNEEQVQKHKS
jgi:colanic acid/amylovoran biosynthesis glycosyltransferase